MNKPGPKPNTNRIGEKRIMKNGLTATIIKYRSSHDIDVQFEDGTIAHHKRYSRFLSGNISRKT